MKRILLVIAMLAAAGCGGGSGERSDDGSGARSEASARVDAPVDTASSDETESDGWADAIDGLERRNGFVTLYIDDDAGRVLAAFPAPDEDGFSLRAIAAAGLTAGLGSNPIGLDRGLFDSGSILAFRKIGAKLIAEQENWAYVASADNPLEKRAVRESFARSFLWAGEIEATSADGALLVDLSGFLTRDSLDVIGALAAREEGSFSLDASRSMPDLANALAFPDNVELDAFLTFSSAKPGDEVYATAADGRSITLVQHISLMRLPDDGYRPRAFDQRAGVINVDYYDFSAPLETSVARSFARRFRLEKQDPNDPDSPAKEPLVFYVDAGAPDQIRDALIDGAQWWGDAFEAAGFPGSYRVEVLPDGVHPRDARYNTILWTHRQTRGWSYGGGVFDPRTGEMLKANVILGSQRVRQDRMIFEGLQGTAKTGSGAADDPVEIALARIRQLSAHEVGHTLGFAHNFAASSNDKASVMDYPAPDVRVGANGGFDFSKAYGVGIGDWDKAATAWLYAEFPDGTDEDEALDKILTDAYASGLRFVGDREGRSVGTGHPFASVWDNGEDAVAALETALAVRTAALAAFGERSLKPGEPIANLRTILVPIYLYHRYQVDAASKLIGGVEFAYGEKGDALPTSEPVSDDRQRAALAMILQTLEPQALDLPTTLLNKLTPPLGTFGLHGGAREMFPTGSDPAFDLLAAADASAQLSLRALLHQARAARLVEAVRQDPNAFGFDDILDGIDETLFSTQAEPQWRAIGRRLQTRYVAMLIDLSTNANAAPEARATADGRLRALSARLSPSLFGGEGETRNHNALLARKIEAHLTRPASAWETTPPAPEIPPGSPIGAGVMETCWHCDPVPGMEGFFR